MNTEEINIKAYELAVEMTTLNIKSKDLKGRKPVKKEHVDNNTAVRKMLAERGISISPSRQCRSQI